MSRYELSRAAAQDIREIRRHTAERFGSAQAGRIRERFQEYFRLLAGEPGLGAYRPEYDPPGRAFRYFPILKRFVVVYQPGAEGIRVARVLDGARDLAAELQRRSDRD